MCDERTTEDNKRYLQQNGHLSRRQFSVLTSAAALAALLPSPANAAEVSGSEIKITTPDGEADCYFVHPASGKHPGVIIWPDIFGLDDAFRGMAKRLAESGYAVLVVNPYYRNEPAPVVSAGASFEDPDTREKLMGLYATMTLENNTTDAQAFIAWLDSQQTVDTSRKVGTMGYCMGGPITMRTAAAVPDRVGAGASFHGAALVTDKPDSPHLLIPKMKASYLVAIAENDNEARPNEKPGLREAFDAAGLSAEIEVYEGALHGWCPPDSPVYNEEQAEHAWSRLLALFETALA